MCYGLKRQRVFCGIGRSLPVAGFLQPAPVVRAGYCAGLRAGGKVHGVSDAIHSWFVHENENAVATTLTVACAVCTHVASLLVALL